jgi:Serine dehydrogenase proteinase
MILYTARNVPRQVRTDMPAEIYQFMELLPQQTRTLPSVEYVPHPERHGQGNVCGASSEMHSV